VNPRPGKPSRTERIGAAVRVDVELRAEGNASPAEAWERYARPALWSTWSPQIRSVGYAPDRLIPGSVGTVHGPAGLRVDFTVVDVDEDARTWSWRVGLGPVALELAHAVEATADGARTTLRVGGPAPVVLGYAPLALVALRRLVRA
jgi:hypothetical protein